MKRERLTPRVLHELYNSGKNIMQLLREEGNFQENTENIIEISYDLQAGSYINSLRNPEIFRHKQEYSAEIARVILSLCNPMSVLEAGVGEATTFSGVARGLGHAVAKFGFDLSWSRIAWAKRFLKEQEIANVTICTGNLFHIPFADNSIDVVYTSHSIEPNGGRERPILQELFRVARRYLVLLEPGYELASDAARARMDMNGYCKGIYDISVSLGYRVLKHELFPCTANPMNPTAITIIEKETDHEPPSHVLACPRFRTPLTEVGGMLFSREALMVYPVVGGIPCLRIENGIIAGQYEAFMGSS